MDGLIHSRAVDEFSLPQGLRGEKVEGDGKVILKLFQNEESE